MEYQFLDDGETEAPFCQYCDTWLEMDESGCLNHDCQELQERKSHDEALEQQGDDKTNERKN